MKPLSKKGEAERSRFEPRLRCDDPVLLKVQDRLICELVLSGSRKVLSKTRALNCLLSNLYMAWQEKAPLGVSLDCNDYRAANSPYPWWTYRTVTLLKDLLDKNELVLVILGIKGECLSGWTATLALVETFREMSQPPTLDNATLALWREKVLLRKGKSREAQKIYLYHQLPQDEVITQTLQELGNYNLLTGLDKVRVDLKSLPGVLEEEERGGQRGHLVDPVKGERGQRQKNTPSDFKPPTLHRATRDAATRAHSHKASPLPYALHKSVGVKSVAKWLELSEKAKHFNRHCELFPGCNQLTRMFSKLDNEELHAGRFYRAAYQNLDKALRPYLTTEGAWTVELDYQSLHPVMIYHLERRTPPPNPYLLKGDPRRIAKRLFNAMLNAKSIRGAVGSLWRGDRPNEGITSTEHSLLVEAGYPGATPRRSLFLLAKDLMAHNAEIGEQLGSNAWTRLQRIDSDIALEVKAHFAHRGITVLCFHDSFRISYRHVQELERVMVEAYRRHVRGFTPQIEWKEIPPALVKSDTPVGVLTMIICSPHLGYRPMVFRPKITLPTLVFDTRRQLACERRDFEFYPHLNGSLIITTEDYKTFTGG